MLVLKSPKLTFRSNHTQATAYILGELAAEKLIREYGLDKVFDRPSLAEL